LVEVCGNAYSFFLTTFEFGVVMGKEKIKKHSFYFI